MHFRQDLRDGVVGRGDTGEQAHQDLPPARPGGDREPGEKGTACGVAEYSVPWWMMLLNRCSIASSASSSSSLTASRNVCGKSSADP